MGHQPMLMMMMVYDEVQPGRWRALSSLSNTCHSCEEDSKSEPLKGFIQTESIAS